MVTDFGFDKSLIDLFVLELETHLSELNKNLLKLEDQSKDISILENLMRAAHSIKGAARVVKFNPIIELAHTLEDTFVAAQEDKVVLNGADIDLILKVLDFFSEILKVDKTCLGEWIFSNHNRSKELEQELISGILHRDDIKLSAFEKDFLVYREELKIKCDELKSLLDKDFLKSKKKITQVLNYFRSVFFQVKEDKLTHWIDKVIDMLMSQKSTFIQIQKEFIEDLLLFIQKMLEVENKSVDQRADQERHINEKINHLHQVLSDQRTYRGKSEFDVVKDRSVKIRVEALNTIMGLAGDAYIESSRLQSFADTFISLKKNWFDISIIGDELKEQVEEKTNYEELLGKVLQVQEKVEEVKKYLTNKMNEFEVLILRSNRISDQLYREIIMSRMRPFSDIVTSLTRLARDLSRHLNKKVKLHIIGENTKVDRDILLKLESPLNQLIRNAIDHGIETSQERLINNKSEEGNIYLEVYHRSGRLIVVIEDDGSGIDLEALKQVVLEKGIVSVDMLSQLSDKEIIEFLFLPGISTKKEISKISGRGVGMDVVLEMMHEIRGVIYTTTEPKKNTRFELQLPLTLSVIKALTIEIDAEPYAFPLPAVDHIATVELISIQKENDKMKFLYNGSYIELISAAKIFGFAEPDLQPVLSIVVISDQSNRYGIIVDRFLGERDLVVQELDSRLGKVRNIGSCAVMEDGSPVLIIDTEDIVRSIQSILKGTSYKTFLEKTTKGKILIVDDSVTIRTIEIKLLLEAGFDVDYAIDGKDAWNALRVSNYDLLITDLDMPRMNGFELIKLIRSNPKYHQLPIIVVTYKYREEEKKVAQELGIKHFMTKNCFYDTSFTRVVKSLFNDAKVV